MLIDKNNSHPWLKSLHLNNGLILPHRIMPGPMEGIMKPLFCRTMSELNLIDYWITPFISIHSAAIRAKKLKQKLQYFISDNKPFIVQFLGSKPELIVETVSNLKKIGITAVNLNFACPSRAVLSSNHGGKMLCDVTAMCKIIESILSKHNDISLSLKLRTGFYSENEMENCLPELSKYNLDFIIIHSRTVSEMYKPINNGPERIKRAVELSGKVPLIASGDVFSVNEAMNVYDKSKCAGVAVARGLFKNPFLIQRIKTFLTDNEAKTDIDYQKLFLKKMCELALNFPEKFKRPNFIEIIRLFYSAEHPVFTELAKITDRELIEYFLSE